jgi:hypothetical protein
MDLVKMTEIFQRGGRDDLIAAIEEFSLSARTEIALFLARATTDNAAEPAKAVPQEPRQSTNVSF